MKPFKLFMACLLSCVLLLCVLLVACSPVERQAYNIVVGGKAALVSYRAKHPECNFDLATGLSGDTKTTACITNNRLTSAKDAIVDAAEVYCAGKDFETGGVCNAPAKGTPGAVQAQAKLKAAVASYEQIERDVKGAIK